MSDRQIASFVILLCVAVGGVITYFFNKEAKKHIDADEPFHPLHDVAFWCSIAVVTWVLVSAWVQGFTNINPVLFRLLFGVLIILLLWLIGYPQYERSLAIHLDYVKATEEKKANKVFDDWWENSAKNMTMWSVRPMPTGMYVSDAMSRLSQPIPNWLNEQISNQITEWYQASFYKDEQQLKDELRQVGEGLPEDERVKALIARHKEIHERMDQNWASSRTRPELLTPHIDALIRDLPPAGCLVEGDTPLIDFAPKEHHDHFRREPLAKAISEITVGVEIPESSRSMHLHMVSNSGHGKTTALGYLIAKDAEDPDTSVIVIDSQAQLIPSLLRCDDIDPDRYVLIDAADISRPAALNPFAIGGGRLAKYDPQAKEQITNTVIELYDFMFSSIMEGAELTGKQSGLFNYVCRLLLEVPGATLDDMVDILQNGIGRFEDYVENLSPAAQNFFFEQFSDKKSDLARTKQEVLRRLSQLLENPTFERMFCQPENKLDLFTAMSEGKIILINTDKDILRERATRVMGRFFLALIEFACQERNRVRNPDPCRVYIDEAHEYIGPNIGSMLVQARKANVSLSFAHQGLYQLTDPSVVGGLKGAAIKMAGDLDADEEPAMARLMRTGVDMLHQPRGSFYTSIKRVGQFPVSFPEDYLERQPQRTEDEVEAIKDASHARYGVTSTAERRMPVKRRRKDRPDKSEDAKPKSQKPSSRRFRSPPPEDDDSSEL